MVHLGRLQEITNIFRKKTLCMALYLFQKAQKAIHWLLLVQLTMVVPMFTVNVKLELKVNKTYQSIKYKTFLQIGQRHIFNQIRKRILI